ncbi:MAG: OmpA family protein [Verrucomicrobia bacterium]|nr:OmpA family protein [Cytophagales bacterium]
MKNLLVFYCLLYSVFVSAQTTPVQTPYPRTTLYPMTDKQTTSPIKILKIDITETQTVVSFVYANTRATSLADSNWISIMPQIELIAAHGKRRFKFIKTEGIPVEPKKYLFESVGRKYFKVFFERLDPGIEEFDLFECINFDRVICFNFFGVHVKNPALPQPVIVKNDPKPTPNNPNNPKPPVKPVSPMVTIAGKVLDAKTRKPVASKIVFEILPGEKVVSTIPSNAATGDYSIKLPAGLLYGYSASALGYLVTEESIDATKVANNQVLTKNILLKPIEVNEVITLKNLFFAQGEYVLLEVSYAELERLVKLMQQNPTMEILLEGHTDIVGDPASNMLLSENRVKAVKTYLTSKGISTSRVQTKAYGGTKPLITEGNDTQRSVNRRVELRILKK